MKRDFALMRDVLVAIEEDLLIKFLIELNADINHGDFSQQEAKELIQERNLIMLHVELLTDLDLIKREIKPNNSYNYEYIRLTMKGYDNIDSYKYSTYEEIYPMKWFRSYLTEHGVNLQPQYK